MEERGCSTWKYPHNNGVGSPFCAIRCLLSSSMKSQDITSHDQIGGLVMATHRLEAMFSHPAAVTGREQNVGNKDIDQASAVMPAMATPPGRRCEARMDYRRMCSYEVLEAIEGKSVVIEQGEAFALNRSTEGSSFSWARPLTRSS